MIVRNFILPVFFLALAGSSVFSQTTISNSGKPNLSEETSIRSTKHKLLIIPFEPRMYMSQIDHKINEETKWNQRKIKESFRFGLDEELYKSIKKRMDVMSLLDDTVKYKKDLIATYQKLGYKFDKIPDQTKYQAPKSEKEQKYLQKGQLIADSDVDGKFMNAQLKDKALLPGFNSKYKTDLFLFINQLDITTSTIGLSNKSVRTATVHYTVFTKDGKEINSGISTVSFPYDVNNPGKISGKYLSKIADEIALRIEKALLPLK